MLSTIYAALNARTNRARTADELRAFHRAELRELGVSDRDIEEFLNRRS